MKKQLVILALFALIMNSSLSQGLEKGSLFGVHKITVTLNPNITMDEFTTFYVNKVLPEYEKTWVGLKGYLVKSFKDEDSFAIVWLFKSVAARNRYFTNGKGNELEKAAHEKVRPIEDKLKREYGSYTITYNDLDDWVVQ